MIEYKRMGQDIPSDDDSDDVSGADFNSPFEKTGFALEPGPRGVRRVYPRAIRM